MQRKSCVLLPAFKEDKHISSILKKTALQHTFSICIKNTLSSCAKTDMNDDKVTKSYPVCQQLCTPSLNCKHTTAVCDLISSIIKLLPSSVWDCK